MAKKKKDDYGLDEVQQIELQPKMLFMVTDKSAPNYGVNFRITKIVEGLDTSLEPIEETIHFQHQIPRGPGRAAEQHHGCPYCSHPFPTGALLTIPATRETPTANMLLAKPKSEFLQMVAEAGAVLVEA